MPAFPIPIEPRYNPANLNSKGARLEWLRVASAGNPTGGYFNQAGEALVTNADQQGHWADADAAHPVPPEWTAAYPNFIEPQRWVPEYPELPNNLIYQYVTAWGRYGMFLNVLGDEAKAAVAAAQVAPYIEPPMPPAPKPAPVPPPPPPGLFVRMWRGLFGK